MKSLNDQKKDDHSKAAAKFTGHLSAAAHHASKMGLAHEIRTQPDLQAPRNKDYKALETQHKNLAEAHIHAAHQMASRDPGLWGYVHNHIDEPKRGREANNAPMNVATTIRAMHPDAGPNGSEEKKVHTWGWKQHATGDANWKSAGLHLPAGRPRKPSAKNVLEAAGRQAEGASMYDYHGGGFGGEKDVGKPHPADKLLTGGK
jgi:hypothetical protein